MYIYIYREREREKERERERERCTVLDRESSEKELKHKERSIIHVFFLPFPE